MGNKYVRSKKREVNRWQRGTVIGLGVLPLPLENSAVSTEYLWGSAHREKLSWAFESCLTKDPIYFLIQFIIFFCYFHEMNASTIEFFNLKCILHHFRRKELVSVIITFYYILFTYMFTDYC